MLRNIVTSNQMGGGNYFDFWQGDYAKVTGTVPSLDRREKISGLGVLRSISPVTYALIDPARVY